jgi:hypothetical protein
MKIKKYSLKKSLRHLLEKPENAQQSNQGDTIKKDEKDAPACDLKKSEAEFHNSFILI